MAVKGIKFNGETIEIPQEYLHSVSVDGNTITFTNADGSTISYTAETVNTDNLLAKDDVKNFSFSVSNSGSFSQNEDGTLQTNLPTGSYNYSPVTGIDYSGQGIFMGSGAFTNNVIPAFNNLVQRVKTVEDGLESGGGYSAIVTAGVSSIGELYEILSNQNIKILAVDLTFNTDIAAPMTRFAIYNANNQWTLESESEPIILEQGSYQTSFNFERGTNNGVISPALSYSKMDFTFTFMIYPDYMEVFSKNNTYVGEYINEETGEVNGADLNLSFTDVAQIFAESIDFSNTKVYYLAGGTSESIDLSNYATKSEVPTATSQLTNDSGFITANDVPNFTVSGTTLTITTTGA